MKIPEKNRNISLFFLGIILDLGLFLQAFQRADKAEFIPSFNEMQTECNFVIAKPLAAVAISYRNFAFEIATSLHL